MQPLTIDLLRLTITASLLLFCPWTKVRAASSLETKILGALLDQQVYDHRVRPPGVDPESTLPHGGPVNVTINMMIRSISKIDDVNMEFSTQLTFREEWVDPRLAYGEPEKRSQIASAATADDLTLAELPAFLVLSTGQTIWMPDTFFQNEKQARRHDIDKPNVLIRIYKNGGILYSVRLSLVLSCPMYLQNYPMDVQQCHIQMGSYAYTDDDINYIWKATNPIQIKKGVETSLPSFTMTGQEVSYCTSKTNTGTYSCLDCTLTMRRQFSYFLLQLYVPTSMLVIVSWVSFWLDRTAVPARVTLGVTSLLTMTTQSSGINAKLPPVSYTKAIDIWIGACLSFIFGALLEFAYVTYTGTRDFHRKSKQRLPVVAADGDDVQSPAADSTIDGDRFEMKQHSESRDSKRGLFGGSRRSGHKQTPSSNYSPKYGYFYPRLDDPSPTSGVGVRMCVGVGATRSPSQPQGDVWVPQLHQQPQPGGAGGDTHHHVCCLQMDTQQDNNNIINQTALLLNDRHHGRMYDNALDAPQLQHLYQMPPSAIPVQAVLLPSDHFGFRRSHRGNSLVAWIHRVWTKTKHDLDEDRSKKIDYLSRFCFPLAFLLFNVFYWFNFSGYNLATEA